MNGRFVCMDKHRPAYDLEAIKELLREESTRVVTQVARRGAVALGYSDEAMFEVVESLSSVHFSKSMTCIANNKLWQDVYKIADGDRKIYIKLQLSPDETKGVLVQFKKDGGGG